MDPGKKISFGFSKISKKPTNLSKSEVKHLDFIDCLEGQSIKLKNVEKVFEKKPLVIPLKDNKKDLLDRVKDMKEKRKDKSIDDILDTRPDSELTENELAVRELLKDAKRKLADKKKSHTTMFVLPMQTPDDLPLDGEKEPTIDDYNTVPVSDFGLAMLRGMGWSEGVTIGKNPDKQTSSKQPELRPKGLGLGANILAKSEASKPASDKNGESLIIKKGSYAKIIAGNQKGNYCEVQGLDDEAGRVIVRTTLKREVLALNEFMVVAVTKEDYSKNSKVINAAKFEEYKEKEHKKIKSEKK